MATAARSEYAWRVGDRARALKLFERAYQCQLAGDLAGAVHLYQASLAELPTAEAHTFLGWVYSFERRYDEAIAECKRAIAVRSEEHTSELQSQSNLVCRLLL